jgi:hypothetical protein
VAAAIVIIPAAIAGVVAEHHLRRARSLLLEGRADLAALDPRAAEVALRRADPEVRTGTAWLTSAATLPARVIPGLNTNLRVAIALARSGRELCLAGHQSVALLESVGAQNGQASRLWHDTAIDVSALQRGSSSAEAVRQRVAAARRLVATTPASFLLPPIGRVRTQALMTLTRAAREADGVAALTSVLPRALGADGPRTWLVGAANTAELRGRSGFWGAFAVVEADRGHVALGEFQGTQKLPTLATAFSGPDVPVEYREHYRRLGGLDAWQNLTMSPNFPSGAKLLLSRLKASHGPASDGAVSLDVTGLSYLIQVTGPLKVAEVPEPLTADNVVDWALNRSYALYPTQDEQRKAVLADIAQAVWHRFLAGTVPPRAVANALGRALREGHLLAYSTDPGEQVAFASLGISGGVDAGPGDYLLVLTQNFGQNKMDYYMHRDVAYRARVGSDGSIEVRLEVKLQNNAPTGQPLPDEVGGANPKLGLGAKVDRSYLSVFVPAGATLDGVTLDGGAATDVENAPELGRRFFATLVEVGAGTSRSVVFTYRVPKVTVRGRYALIVQNQATVHPDNLSVRVTLPDAEGIPKGQRLANSLSWSGPLTSELHLGSPLSGSNTRLAAG